MADPPVGRIGVLLLGLCFATASWNAVVLHGFQLADWMLAAAAVVVALDCIPEFDAIRPPPVGMWLGAILLILSGVWSAVEAPSAGYLAQRYVIVNPYLAYGNGKAPAGSLTQLAKFEIALIVLPIVVSCARLTRRDVAFLVDCWLVGTTINALCAISDQFLHTAFYRSLVGFVDVTGRQAGLTQQPNHLALAIALAIPIAATWLNRRRVPGVLMLIVLFVALLLTGSRGGLLVGILALPVTMLALNETRRWAFWCVGGGLLAFAAYASNPARLVAHTRFGSQAAKLSDSSRLHLLRQGIADWLHSPWHGVGFTVINDAHEVHIQLLAAGGVVAMAGALAYGYSMVGAARRSARMDPLLGRALLIAICSWLLCMFVENQLTNLYLYMPVALVAVLGQQGEVAMRYSTFGSSRSDTAKLTGLAATSHTPVG